MSTWICCSDSWKLESISLMTETMKCSIHLVSSSRVLYRLLASTMVFSCRSPLDLSYPVMINYEDTSYMEHGILWCFVVSENSCYNLKSILSSPAIKRCAGRHWQDAAVSGVSSPRSPRPPPPRAPPWRAGKLSARGIAFSPGGSPQPAGE